MRQLPKCVLTRLRRPALLRSGLRGIVLSAGLVLASPSAGFAAPSASDIKKAAEAFDRGREAYRIESYVEAAEYFEAADDSAASASALRLAMAARSAAGQVDRALTLAALALQTYPDDPDVQREAEALLSDHQAEFARIEVSCDEPCELTLDNKLVHGPRAKARVVFVAPGSYEVQASWGEDRLDGRRVTAVAGESRDVELFAPAVAAPAAVETNTSWYQEEEREPAAEEKPPKGWSPAVFWTGFGLTAAGLAATTGLGINALNNPGADNVQDNCDPTDFENCDLYQEGLANQTAANVAGGVTAAVGLFTIVTGIWLTNWSGKKKEKATPAADTWSTRTSPNRLDAHRAGALQLGPLLMRPTVSIGNGATLGAVGTF